METETLKTLIKQRGLLKGQLTRLNNFLKSSESLDISTLEIRKIKLEEIYTNLNATQFKIECLDELENHDQEREQFENMYFECADFIARSILNINSLSNLPKNNIANDAVPTSNVLNTNFPSILPKIQIKQFDGSFAEWHNFHDTYKSLVHENEAIPAVHKFHLLKSYLCDEAAIVINSLNATQENYLVAWDLLKKRFNKPRKIIHSHIRALFELPDVTRESGAKLRTLTERAEMHINALKSLKQPVEWHEMLIYIVSSKLDKQTRIAWERSIDDQHLPTITELFTFLTNYARDAEPIHLFSKENDHKNREKHTNYKPSRNPQAYVSTQPNLCCPMCKHNHFISSCQSFLTLEPQERLEIVKKAKLCINCLRNNHFIGQCTSGNCRICKKKHNTLLHIATNHLGSNKTHTQPIENTPLQSPSTSALVSFHSAEVLLSTARVKILDKYNKEHECRVLLDACSQSNFITERLASRLQLEKHRINLPATGLGQQKSIIEYCVATKIRARNTNFSSEATFLALPCITAILPSQQVNRDILEIPTNISLADPEFHKPAEIDALLGEYLFYKLLCVGQLRLKNGTTVLQKTRLGWIISGKADTSLKPIIRCHFSSTSVEAQLTKFWELEEVRTKPHLSKEEEMCEAYFQKTTERDVNGHYIIRLPFNQNRDHLGESYKTALKRFYSLERKLDQNIELREQYVDFLKEYQKLGHMTDITDSAKTEEGYYLPHHAVVKEGSLTTKIRVVFDASAKTTTGASLNDTLLAGPTIQEDVLSLITRFRSYTYVLSADIEKMFRQIYVHPKDRIYQKVLWRDNQNSTIKTYQLNTVTYGTTSAPFLAVRCLHQLADDEGQSYPAAAVAMKNDFYMDDLLTGAQTIELAKKLRDELIHLSKSGGFNLRQWASNDPALISDIQDHASSEYLCLDSSVTKKTLGIYWNRKLDIISYKIDVGPQVERITKRSILSKIAQLFDPLGLLGPVIITAKIIMQNLWKCKVEWDETVPQSIHTTWENYKRELPRLSNFSVPRAVIKGAIDLQLHGFCDASEQAYGACIYLRCVDSEGNITVRLVCAKSRVAPLKVVSIPRLELCAAVLLVNLYVACAKALKLSISLSKFWSDSTITLHWINTSPHTLKTFVANRVAEIQTHTEASHWSHVSSSDNPADFISRGQTPADFIENTLWREGPSWLSAPETTWPILSLPYIDIPERRNTISLVVTNCDNNMFLRFSSFNKLQRVIAYCLRFLAKLTKGSKAHGELSVEELHKAHNIIILNTQLNIFSKEISELKQGGVVNNKSKLKALNPFMDSEGILRVGGRLKHANITYSQRHPILLPRSHHITHLIIRKEHIRHLHAGILATLNAVRQAYWPIDGKNTTRHIVRKCIKCFRVKPVICKNYTMGNLPRDRFHATRPFENTGIDYCGPFFIKEKRFRNQKRVKTYVAVFVCFLTKAVHLELVSDLSTEAFISCFKRFYSRRGLPQIVYTDNATTFVGARNKFSELEALLNSSEHHTGMSHFFSDRGIKWHFSPPRSPHFGGLWEAAVKSFKHHMVRVVGETLFTYEQLNTYIVEIEAILNSRPITPLSSDPNDYSALTPGHFLIGGSLTSAPEANLLTTRANRLSNWQHIQQLKQHFWARWYKEYLNELNIRTKWRDAPLTQIKVDTLVIIKDDNLPPMRWILGRVIAVHPGDDSVVRVATVKTNYGTYTRSVKKLCPLPVDKD